jgi:hypothetical protein
VKDDGGHRGHAEHQGKVLKEGTDIVHKINLTRIKLFRLSKVVGSTGE